MIHVCAVINTSIFHEPICNGHICHIYVCMYYRRVHMRTNMHESQGVSEADLLVTVVGPNMDHQPPVYVSCTCMHVLVECAHAYKCALLWPECLRCVSVE